MLAILEIEPKEIPKNLYKSDNKKNKAILTKYGEDRSAVQASVQWLIKQACMLLMVLRSDVGLMTDRISNCSSKWRWQVVDIYQGEKRRGEYPPLATSTEVNSCFSIY